MKVRQISGPPVPVLACALAEFEAPFTYPLGPGKFFRISHGEDFTLFFRAQGTAACFIAENKGRIVGALGTAIRRLWLPDGTDLMAAYIGDLKIAAEARGGTVLVRLARAAEGWLRPKVQAAIGVVMEGTALTPERYTGRAGIPDFQDLGRLIILRISGSDESVERESERFVATSEAGLACFRRLTLGHYACPASDALKRSHISPVWLMDPDGSACAMLEDTRRAKRLISGDGSELLSAHLSCFAYSTAAAWAKLVGIALRRAIVLGLPALFVAVAEPDACELRAKLRNFEVLTAPATVYGAGLMPGLWNINSSEI